jgi:hypothetical protein
MTKEGIRSISAPDAFFDKPVDKEKLLAKIKEFLPREPLGKRAVPPSRLISLRSLFNQHFAQKNPALTRRDFSFIKKPISNSLRARLPPGPGLNWASEIDTLVFKPVDKEKLPKIKAFLIPMESLISTSLR